LHCGLSLSDELQQLLDRFGVEGQERRAARTFAICGLAGELATRWNIVPWETGNAAKAAMHAFELWRRRRGANGQGVEHATILRALSDFIDRHSDSRFSNIDGSSDIVRDRAGYWRQDGDRRLYLFTSSGLREATKGYDLLRVLTALDKAKALAATDLDKRSKKTRDPNGRAVPLYHIDPDALSSDEYLT
jgi:putative DNA primase/helicase